MITALLLSAALAGASVSAPAPAAPSAAAAPATQPSPEVLALARKVAARDDFLVMIQSVGAGQTAEVEKSMGDLTPEEKTKVDAIGRQKMEEGTGRVVDRLATIYASSYSLDDLRVIAAFLETRAGQAYSGRLLTTLTALGEAMKGFDFKRQVRAEACLEIKKGCEAESMKGMNMKGMDKPAPPATAPKQ